MEGWFAHVSQSCCVRARVCVWATDHSQESQRARCSRCSGPFSSLLSSPLLSSSFPLISFSSHPLPSEAPDKVSLYNRSQGQTCGSRLFSLWCVHMLVCVFMVKHGPVHISGLTQTDVYLTLWFIQNHHFIHF